MKYQVSVSEFTDLSEDEQKLYSSEKDGNHTIKIDGLPKQEDVSGLKAKVEQLLTEAKDAKKKTKDAEKLAADAAMKKASNDGDVEALEKSWQTKYDTLQAGLTTERDDALGLLGREKVHSRAVELATILAVQGSADVLLPHIESRLSMEIEDGRAVTIVNDTAGKRSALTVEELGKEIAANAAFAPLIVASNAAGGGANGKNSGGAAKQKTATRTDFASWSPDQQKSFSVEGGTLTE